jgi:hypothetical protein
MTYRGDLILESMSKPEMLPPLAVASVRRVRAIHGPELPRLRSWTILTLDVASQDEAHALAVAFSHCADPGHLGWYLDLLGPDEHLFAFLGRVFTVTSGDGYAEVLDFCAHRGIPRSRLTFPRLGAVPSSGRD